VGLARGRRPANDEDAPRRQHVVRLRVREDAVDDRVATDREVTGRHVRHNGQDDERGDEHRRRRASHVDDGERTQTEQPQVEHQQHDEQSQPELRVRKHDAGRRQDDRECEREQHDRASVRPDHQVAQPRDEHRQHRRRHRISLGRRLVGTSHSACSPRLEERSTDLPSRPASVGFVGAAAAAVPPDARE